MRTSNMTFKDLIDNETVIKAVLYDIIIIDEVSANIPEDMQQKWSKLPWRLMKDMRNVAAHEYCQVDLPTIWRTLERSLPPLIEPLQTILEQET